MKKETIRKAVRENYKNIALGNRSGCGCTPSCCDSSSEPDPKEISLQMGYCQQDLEGVPQEANLGLGCGNPGAIAGLKEGETVLDLGSGGGFDCFLAAPKVGPSGKVIGVDMTPEMVSKARTNAAKSGFDNVEFRLGEIENLPLADQSVDVIISNCVINLSPDKGRVFAEAFRVLKPGGRLAVSDVVTTAELPGEIKEKMAFYTGCVAGACSISDLEAMLIKAGFEDISIEAVSGSREFIRHWIPGSRIEDYVVSAAIQAVKPHGG